jgi:hypothetical protein
MEDPTRDGSMIIRAAAGQALISRETALGICNMVIADLFGDEERQRQSPLRIEDRGNVWTILGSRILAPDASAAERGRVQMSISKLDGAIVSFTL